MIVDVVAIDNVALGCLSDSRQVRITFCIIATFFQRRCYFRHGTLSCGNGWRHFKE